MFYSSAYSYTICCLSSEKFNICHGLSEQEPSRSLQSREINLFADHSIFVIIHSHRRHLLLCHCHCQIRIDRISFLPCRNFNIILRTWFINLKTSYFFEWLCFGVVSKVDSICSSYIRSLWYMSLYKIKNKSIISLSLPNNFVIYSSQFFLPEFRIPVPVWFTRVNPSFIF